MVQEFHVVRCFSCQTFQVQQVKKVNRWSCKLCGEKQSLLKEFGRGSAANCRRLVQELNAIRGAKMEKEEEHAWSLWTQVEADGEEEPEEQRDDQVSQTQVSRWSKYLDTPEEDDDLLDRQQLHGNNMINRKRKRSEGQMDGGQEDACTPEQSNWVRLKRKPVRPQNTTRTTTRATSLDPPSPPSEQILDPPSVGPSSVSRWSRFLSTEEGRIPVAVGGVSQWAEQPLCPVMSDFDDDEPPTANRL